MALTKTATIGAGASANAAAPVRPGGGPGGWHPTILWMLGLMIAEVLIVGFLSRHLLK